MTDPTLTDDWLARLADPTLAGATLGGILAGGQARRLGGGDKGRHLVGGRSVLDRVIACLGPQVARLVLNANDDPARFAATGLAIVPDSLPDRPGPLAGVLALLDWAAANTPAVGWVATAPADAPFLPPDLVARLHAARRERGAAMACAASGGRAHHVVALWPVALRADLRRAVQQDGMRRVEAFAAHYAPALAEWPTAAIDPFFNVNTPEDLAQAERLATL